MNETTAQVFGIDGLLAQRFEGYKPRTQQITLTSAVFDSMANGTRLLAEAPCGVGKSIAYLVPAIYHVTEGAPAVHAWRATLDADTLEAGGFDEEDTQRANDGSRPRVVIVTANIALQEQLMQKDLPLLASLLPWEFTTAIAKGRSNYICLFAADESAAELVMEPHKLYPEERQQWNAVDAWRPTTTTGDLSELPFVLVPSLKHRLTMTSDDCTGKACPRHADCFAEKARAKLKTANVIVTNYHLFFAHLQIAKEFGVGVLPRFEFLVMDEAHEASTIARDFMGFRIGEGAFKWATRFLGPKPAKGKVASVYDIAPELRLEILQLGTDLFYELADLRASKDYFARLKKRVPGTWPLLVEKLVKAGEMLDKTTTMGLSLTPQQISELRKASRRCRLLAQNLEVGLDPEKDEEGRWAFFLDEVQSGRDKRVYLCAKPIDVADELRRRVFEARCFRSVVGTSATLATGTGPNAFDFIVEELGADCADELLVGSPFDFEQQALLVIPRGLPDPTKQRDVFNAGVAEVACDLVTAANGRTLLLFTSHAAVKVAADMLRRRFGSRYTLLVQGDAPRMQLVERFRKEIGAVLLGTRSLWTGVDISGEALSALLVDKLPFDPPTDPVLDAKNEKDPDTFMTYSLPRAAIALRQGFGRLIRSTTDAGVVVICDKRLVEKPYGKRIKRALPAAPLSRNMDDVVKFFEQRAVESFKNGDA